jgi:hypothetical protein
MRHLNPSEVRTLRLLAHKGISPLGLAKTYRVTMYGVDSLLRGERKGYAQRRAWRQALYD